MMKKYYVYVLLLGFVLVLFWLSHRGESPPTSIIPPKITDIGPTAQYVEITKKIGSFIVKFKAEHIFFKRLKILIFKSNLMKVLVARDVIVTILKPNKKKFILKKSEVTLKPNLEYIAIDHPTLLFPKNVSTPDKVVLDFKNSKILFYYKNVKKELS